MSDAIGILTASGAGIRLGGNTANFARVIRAARAQDVPCNVFNLDKMGHLRAFTYQTEHPHFRENTRIEFPKVLYNRIPTRALERDPMISDRLQNWAAKGHIIVNPRFLTKADFISLWLNDPILQPHVPMTAKLTGSASLTRFLRDYGTTYVKPLDGKAGSGIFLLTPSRDQLQMQLQRLGHVVDLGSVPVRDAFHKIQSIQRHGESVLQQAVETRLFRDRKFDLRLLMHRVPSRSWEITGTGVRIGPLRGITTHVPNGGKLGRPEVVLKELFADQSQAILDQVSAIVKRAAARVATLPGTWCELSFDVGLDPDGSPVLYEANAKPMKFDEPRIETRAKERLILCLQRLA